MSRVLRLNPVACAGHGACAELLPELISLDEWGYPVLAPGPVPAGLARRARRAVAACPALALAIAGSADSAHSEKTQSQRQSWSLSWAGQAGNMTSMTAEQARGGPEQARGGAEAPLRRPDGSAVRVLVVDDEPSLAELLASVLRYEGWDIQTAGDGKTAVRAAREFRPDAVILDVMLPDISGLEVLSRLRAELPHVCVLFLTARDAVEDRIAGITAGGDDYVTKPFSLEEVLARLRGLLRRAGLARAGGAAPSWWPATWRWTRRPGRSAAAATSSS